MAERFKNKENQIDRRFFAFALTTSFALSPVLAGCSFYDGTFRRGYQADPDSVKQVKVGQTAEQVLAQLGSPSTTSTVGGDAWYYISQTINRSVAFMTPEVVDQRVLALYFNKSKKLERIADYGLKDGKVFDFVSRTTPSAGGDIGFVQNMLTGLLRFD